ncbi:hypothetical protein UVI_02064490 [Ustilaginoidea virens]|uniref:Uncharacterized protein n=1 Tax=Ustilaginoidea virens TaxID=1159556 RepID=A0A1B5L8K1_USTVR|nr:hypothetical protein UVI_02064490 [Ustilaginoidea virens]
MPSVLEALQWSTAPLDVSSAPPGTITRVRSDNTVDMWSDWEDFTYDNIMAIYGNDLRSEYLGQREPTPLRKDLVVYDENSVESALRRFPFSVINSALDSMVTLREYAPYYTHGSRCYCGGFIPDWSCVSDLEKKKKTGEYQSLVPGDTKPSHKWNPDMFETKPDVWQMPLNQVATYIAYARVRYGFIVTDREAVVLRFSREATAAGVGTSLPQRLGRNVSFQLPSEPSVLSSESYGDSASGWDFFVEYKAIPWCKYGQGTLTAKLALAVLAMMSLYGDNQIAYRYPGLNTWRTATSEEGGGLKHNTSGHLLKGISQGIVIEEPTDSNNDSESREDASMED